MPFGVKGISSRTQQLDNYFCIPFHDYLPEDPIWLCPVVHVSSNLVVVVVSSNSETRWLTTFRSSISIEYISQNVNRLGYVLERTSSFPMKVLL